MSERASHSPMNIREAAGAGSRAWCALAVSLSLGTHLWALWGVRNAGLEPYMDEVFHLPMTQHYCRGEFGYWDSKITTLPGLYLAGAAYGAALGAPCTPEVLRGLNAMLAAGTAWIIFLLLRRKMGSCKALAQACVLSSYPIHFFFSLLFYTDTGATFLVLAVYWLASSSRPSRARLLLAMLLGIASILFRQTNAVWCLFLFAESCLKWLTEAQGKSHDSATGAEELAGPLSLRLLASFSWLALSSARSLVSALWPLCMPVAAFAAFLVWNGGSVVVGDAVNHTPVLHTAQLAYLSVASAAMYGPLGQDSAFTRLWLCLRQVVPGEGRKEFQRLFSFKLAFLLVVASVALHFGTFSHPFLLADNRHYTFYAWRRVLKRNELAPLFLFPIYAFAAWHVSGCLRRGGRSPLWIFLFVVCSALSLVPSPLLEPRYLTLPVLLVHLNSREPSWAAVGLTGLGCSAVNILTVHVFLHRTFQWPDGSIARLMW
jgi:alpha-1,2-glucosyltransferase